MTTFGQIFFTPTPALLWFVLAPTIFQTTVAIENRSNHVRVLRLEGSSSTELSASTSSPNQFEAPGFTLVEARLDNDSMGFLARLRSVLTIRNGDSGRRITEVGWQLDVYDESLRSLSHRFFQSEKINIYPGETGAASAKLGAILPDRMIILLQIVKVSFADGSAWSPAMNCSLEEDLRTVSCK